MSAPTIAAPSALPSILPTGIPHVDTWQVRAHVAHIMGLPISIHVRAAEPDRPDVRPAVERVWAHFHEVDHVFSTWKADSEVMRIRAGELAPDDAHPWLGEVQALCHRAQTASRGLFTTDLVGPDGTRGWDPTGLVKGWSVDKAADILAELPGIAFAINAGGDIRCVVTPGGPRAPWTVGIEEPSAPGTIAYTATLNEGALATSGTGARGYHIVDPRTGMPAMPDLTSVTVVGPELTWADVWATVCFLDPDAIYAAGPEWSVAYRMVGATGQPAAPVARLA